MIIKEINSEISNDQLTEIREQMLKFARLQLHDRVLAEDMVQEALLSAVKNIHNFQRQAALKTWIFAILKNKIIDHLRRKDRFITESELAGDENATLFFEQDGHWHHEYCPQQWPENSVYSDEFWILFETCLTHLPARQGRVFMMREYLELSADEICKEVEISNGNLHTLLHRARLQLQQCLSTKLMLGINK